MVDQVLLNDTLQKINASLNKRFEKDAELYISRQDEYEIKKNLCNGAYGGVVDMAKAKGISHDIIVKVLLRNAGVINVTDIGKFEKELRPVLQNADYRALSYIMEDVLSNSVYMQKKVRHILFVYYMNGITSTKRMQYWERGDLSFDAFERKQLYQLILSQNRYRNASETLDLKIDFMNDAFERFPDILKDEGAMMKLKESLDDEERIVFFEYLSEEMYKPFMESDIYDFVLADTYASYGETAFDDAVSRIKSNSPKRFKQYIRVICKRFRLEKDKDTLLRMFDTICRVFESAYIKNHIKREINSKVWKAAKKNNTLYQERKVQIDGLLGGTEGTDTDRYSSFDDVAAGLSNGTNLKSIAFFWGNIKSPAFEKSIVDSFTGLDEGYTGAMHEVYSWLFNHSKRKGGIKELNHMCEKVAAPLYRFANAAGQSVFFDEMDDCWLENVIRYKLSGENIKKYMFKVHFDRVKEWQ